MSFRNMQEVNEMLKSFLKKLIRKVLYPVSWRTGDLYELFCGHKESFKKSKQLILCLLAKVNKYRQSWLSFQTTLLYMTIAIVLESSL